MIDNDSFLSFAMTHYHEPALKTMTDFNEDLNRIMYIKKLLNRITAGESVDFLLIHNHLRILFNVFDAEALVAMLYFKMEENLWGLLKTFLLPFGVNKNLIPYLDISIKDVHTVESIEREFANVWNR